MDRKYYGMGAAALIAGIGLVWWMSPKGQPTPETATEASAPTMSRDGVILLSAQQIKSLGLIFGKAEAAQTVPLASLPATIAPPPNARVAVAAQLPGIVTRVYVLEGDAVRAGQPLATISSRDMVTLNADLARAQARLNVARSQASRTRQLGREGIIAGARVDEASAMLAQAQVDVQEQRRLIGMANGSAGGSGYTLTAPISGRISAMTIETGKALDQGAAPFVIDATNRYQARAQLPARLISVVRPGMSVHIAPDITGKVSAVGAGIDPTTRSATLTADLPASDGVVSGHSTTLTVYGAAPADAVRVPATSIVQNANAAMIFVKTGKGIMPRKVQLAEGGPDAEGNRIVLSGLKPGETIALTAISELKSLAAAQ